MSEVNIANDALAMAGENLANNTLSMKGLGKWVRIGGGTGYGPSTFRTRQSVYRAVAWLLVLTEKHDLPDETDIPELADSFSAILRGVCAQEKVDFEGLTEVLYDENDEI
jgi:hypothetical protein